MKTSIAWVASVLAILAANRGVAMDGAVAPQQKPKYAIDERGAGELFTTTATLQVLSAPKAGSTVLREYGKGAMMAVLGEATGTGYLYVSPCNACENGFVLKTEFQAKTGR